MFLTLPSLVAPELPFTCHGDDGKIKINIRDLQKIALSELGTLFSLFIQHTTHSKLLIERITKPLLDRITTIQELGLGYLMTIRQIQTLSGGEIQRLRLAKQLGNKLT